MLAVVFILWKQYREMDFSGRRVKLPKAKITDQVTSRGCNRAFIVCVLYRVLNHVVSVHQNGTVVEFPLDKELLRSWMASAVIDAQDSDLNEAFGGTVLCTSDPATFWNDPQQFSTW